MICFVIKVLYLTGQVLFYTSQGTCVLTPIIICGMKTRVNGANIPLIWFIR